MYIEKMRHEQTCLKLLPFQVHNITNQIMKNSLELQLDSWITAAAAVMPISCVSSDFDASNAALCWSCETFLQN